MWSSDKAYDEEKETVHELDRAENQEEEMFEYVQSSLKDLLKIIENEQQTER